MNVKQLFLNLHQKNEKAFMAHVYCGDPTISFSKKLVSTLSHSGVDILELGIPFSDPIADGKVFQQACQRALDNNVTSNDIFELIRDLRKTNFKLPIILTTYYNVIFQKGIERFVNEVAQNKVQGLIVPDLSLEESDELYQACKQKNIHLIYLITPTTTDKRLKKILARASGFIYVVSKTGVTGSGNEINKNIKNIVTKIRKMSDMPLLIGFGISKPEDVKRLKQIGIHGFIVGSKICRLYNQNMNENKKLQNIRMFSRKMKQACRINPHS